MLSAPWKKWNRKEAESSELSENSARGGGNEIAGKTEHLKQYPGKTVLLIVILKC
jgi:hypothetical protein